MLLVLPLLTAAQEKNVISYNRILVKGNQIQAFEKALTTHSQKYHKEDVRWRVYAIESGQDAGSYLIIEGPTTWEAMDKRGNLGTEHTNDWERIIMPMTTEKIESGYMVFRPDLSTTQLGEFTDKAAVNHVYYKPGYAEESEVILKNLKKTWDASGQTIAVYESSSSGPPHYIVVTRYKQGLKERTPGFYKPMKERYETENGNGSWNDYQTFLKNGISHSWSEMISHRKELGSN